MSLLTQTEKEYWTFTIDKRNRRYVEYSNRLFSLSEEIMLGTDVYEWLGEVATRNRNGTQLFGNLRTNFGVPGEHLKLVAEANQILENIHYKNENTAFNFEFYVKRIKESYKMLKDHGGVHNYSQKVQKLIRGIHSDTPA